MYSDWPLCCCPPLTPNDSIPPDSPPRRFNNNQQVILESLSPSLRREVILFTNAHLINRLPALAREPPEVQAFIVERLKRNHAVPGELFVLLLG